MHMISRKLITTVFTTAMVSLAMGLFTLRGFTDTYHLGNALMGWTYASFMYVGAIIFTYGNIVSICLEIAQKKWFAGNRWLYITLHGVFGLANGLLFNNGLLALFGTAAALLYACVDSWIFVQSAKQKSVEYVLLVPIFIYLTAWVVFEYISPEEPPFTMENAVAFATSGDGTVTDVFPEKIGSWQGVIGEYEVTRETSAERIGNEKYIVTFTETWKKDGEIGSWSLAYEVERNSLSALFESGDLPDYYKDES